MLSLSVALMTVILASAASLSRRELKALPERQVSTNSMRLPAVSSSASCKTRHLMTLDLRQRLLRRLASRGRK